LLTSGSSAPYDLVDEQEVADQQSALHAALGILNASTRNVLMPTNITTEIVMILAQSHRNSRLPRARFDVLQRLELSLRA
jgi:hypothetical protein